MGRIGRIAAYSKVMEHGTCCHTQAVLPPEEDLEYREQIGKCATSLCKYLGATLRTRSCRSNSEHSSGVKDAVATEGISTEST